MNKLEELKALEKEKDKWRLELVNAQNANDDDEVIRSYYAEYRRVIKALDTLKNELLPDLIAVAEAAQSANDRWEAKDWDAESTNVHIKRLEEADDNYFALAKLLEPLTKETDK